MPTLKAYAEKLVTPTEEEWKMLEKNLQVLAYKKGETLAFPNNICDGVYYICSGLIRSYIIDSSGQDATRQLHFNNEHASVLNLFVVDYVSMTKGLTATIGFEVLNDCKLMKVSKEMIEGLHEASQIWEKLSRKTIELAYMETAEFYQSIVRNSAKENYINIRNNMSHLLDLVPQYHLATYIGVTPVTLSRIKKELDGQKNS